MKILVPLAEGFEEIETMSIVDVLRRAGHDVVLAGIPGSIITGSRGVRVLADKMLKDIDENDFDVLVLPGGYPGYINLGKSQRVSDIIKKFNEKQKTVAAICAAPSVLAKAGVLNDRKATIYPGMEKEIPRPRGDRVVVDGNIITGQGPGAAMEFALKIVEVLDGKEKAEKLKRDLVC